MPKTKTPSRFEIFCASARCVGHWVTAAEARAERQRGRVYTRRRGVFPRPTRYGRGARAIREIPAVPLCPDCGEALGYWGHPTESCGRAAEPPAGKDA